MRLLFEIDAKDYDPHGLAYVRPSVRSILIRENRVAMVYSPVYDHYKFPGGGIEPGESREAALARETLEEAGLIIRPDSVRAYGYVHRIQRGQREAVFIQDNDYYFCEAEPLPVPQRLDGYEAEEGFALTFADPAAAIRTNREGAHGPKNPRMLEREARVLEMLIREDYFTG